MGTHGRRGSRANAAGVLLLLVALLALAACGGSSDTASSTPSAMTSPSVAASPSATPLPAPTVTGTIASGGSSTAPTDLPARTTPVAAVTFPADQKPESGGTGGSTGGLEFVPWVDIEVSALGYYDHGQDGLRNDHKVVIWDFFREKTVTPTVIVTSASDLDGQFRYEPIAPVVLKAGTHYVVAFLGDMDGDPGTHPKEVVWAPELRFVGWRERDNSWGFPSLAWDFLDVSGNFKFLPVSTASLLPTP